MGYLRQRSRDTWYTWSKNHVNWHNWLTGITSYGGCVTPGAAPGTLGRAPSRAKGSFGGRFVREVLFHICKPDNNPDIISAFCSTPFTNSEVPEPTRCRKVEPSCIPCGSSRTSPRLSAQDNTVCLWRARARVTGVM